MLSLSQYYDQRIKELGHRSWNHFCADPEYTEEQRIQLKKNLKREYKEYKQNESR